jgi:hypothetical protein
MGKRLKDPQKIAKKWSQNLQAATEQMLDGVNSLTVSPTQQAAAKKDVMKARLLAAIDNGKWEKNLRAVSLDQFQQAYRTKAIPRIQQGAVEGESKEADFLTQFLPFAAQVSAEIDQMPNTSDQDRKNRMLANFDKMKKFSRNRR